MSVDYVELHARSAFSFLEGASTPEELIAACKELKMPAMALLDRDGLYGAPRFHLAANKLDIKAHIGAELSVQSPTSKVQSQRTDVGRSTLNVGRKRRASDVFTLPLLVRNRTGYQNLCRLITLMKLRVPKHAKPGECAITVDELAEYAEGLVCLTGADDGPIANTLNQRGHREALKTTEWLVEIFGKENVYAELQR